MAKVSEIIENAENGNILGIKEAFSEILKEKIAEAIDAKKVGIVNKLAGIEEAEEKDKSDDSDEKTAEDDETKPDMDDKKEDK